jgi:hypothetical protein
MGLSFPLYYRPRPYQAELHAMWRKYRTGIAVFPRQSGKDVAGSMEMCEARLKRPKTTGVYIAPDRPSIKNILWDKTYFDKASNQHVKMLQDNVPKSEVKWGNTALEGVFTNESRLKLEGYFQSGKDNNGVGTSFQDYFFTELSLFGKEDPIPRLMPIITSGEENGDPKRLMAVATPRGKRKNPLWLLMESIKNDPKAKVLIRTIDDLNEIMKKNGLPPVRSQQQLELDKDTYLRRFGNSRMFEQEYYVSFEEMDAAAVYGEALSKMIAERRTERFNLNPQYPVYVAFDIGSAGKHSDATAWIAFQWYNNKLFLYDCGEGHGKALPEYVDDLQAKRYFHQISHLILPWDANHHEVSIRETPADMMRARFPNVAVLARGTNIYTVKGLPTGDDSDRITMIQQVRLALYNTYVNGLDDNEKLNLQLLSGPNCDRVIDCMENYKYAYDNKKQEWTQYPVHDQYSHIMDALRTVVQATKDMDFFGAPYDPTGGTTKAPDKYEQDWKGAW